MRAQLVVALVLAFAAASAHAEIISLVARPPEVFGDYLRVAFVAHGRYIGRGDAAKPEAIYDVEAVLWRPVKGGATLLVETEPEPANALAANAADVRQIARRRGMTILFAAPSLKKCRKPCGPPCCAILSRICARAKARLMSWRAARAPRLHF